MSAPESTTEAKAEGKVRVRKVGLDLQDNDDTRPLVDAIERDNPGAEVRYMPGIVHISLVGELDIQRLTVEEILGREWETHELQLSIVSYVGHISEWDDDHILIKWEH